MSVSATFAVQAQEFLEQGHPAEAIALCRQGLNEYPDYVTAYLVLARAFIAVGDYASAEQALERGAKQSPRSTTTRALRKEVQYALRLKELKEKQAVAPVNGGVSSGLPSGLQSALQEASEAATYLDSGETLPAEQAERTMGTYLRIIETDRSSDEQHTAFRSNNLRLIPGLDFTPLRMENPSAAQQAAQQRNTSVPEPPPLTEFADWQQYQESLRNDQAVSLPLEHATADFINAEMLSGEGIKPEMLKPQTGYSRPPMPTPRFSIREIENLPVVETEAVDTNDIDHLAGRLMQAQMPAAKDLLTREADIPEYLRQNSGETVSDSLPHAGTVIISETMAKIYEAQGALAQALHAYKTLAAEADAQHNDEKAHFFAEKIQHMQARIAAQPTGV
ncbi:MAG: tetratricopeptide repeat protein [Ignavibacteria bacterium]|nr:tetratricopeptide repeat protein [Ignavibacteria bacterium]